MIRIKLENTEDCIKNILDVVSDTSSVFIEDNRINIGCCKFNLGSTLIKNDDGELFVREDNWDRKVFF